MAPVKLLFSFLLLFSGSQKIDSQPAGRVTDVPKFLGREITVIEPEHDEDGFPKGSASVCVEGPPQRQCYTAPKDYGNSPTVEVIQLDRGRPAIFFSAAMGGGSGWL